jgi:N-methylhydantoinase A
MGAGGRPRRIAPERMRGGVNLPFAMARPAQPLRIAIDTGGTFTDCVWRERGQLRMLKVFSTPGDPSQAIAEAVRQVGHGGQIVLLHGTTVGTNTVLERKGARTALVTTAGFEDAIEIGRQARPKLYDFFFDRVEPLVPSELRFGVNERVASDGQILASPTDSGLKLLVSRVAGQGPESIAVSLLFSFVNSTNEVRVTEALRAIGIPLSISHQILPEFREYERTSTVVINAYLQPAMQRYLENLARSVAALPQRLTPNGLNPAVATGKAVPVSNTSVRIFVMQSSGGLTSLATAAREPVRTVLSGPAGGVVGAAASARASGFERIIAFDMGGTSTDVSLVEGEIRTASDAQVAGLPISVPMLDIHTVGVGGGSLARFDAAGVLRVGPESAGADPGPICYGRGTQPTVTDANLLLGRLQPARFLGGAFTLDRERTRRITQAWLKRQRSSLTLEKFAAGVVRVVNATMEKAIRVVSIERGRDPRGFALVAFGGAGGLHACALADALSIPQVIIPAFPGALSALGILASDVVKDYSRTVLWRVSGKIPAAKLQAEFAAMEKIAAKEFREEAWPGKAHYRRSVDIRYRGQGYELNVPFTNKLQTDFESEHKRRYGYSHPDREVELVTLRLRGTIKSPRGASLRGETPVAGRSRRTEPGLRRSTLIENGTAAMKIYDRAELRSRKNYSGPAIITEYSATTVVPPGKAFKLDRTGNLVITRE